MESEVFPSQRVEPEKKKGSRQKQIMKVRKGTELPVIRLAGTDLTQMQLEVFHDFHNRNLKEKYSVNKIAEKHGVTAHQIHAWRKTEWWYILFNEYVKGHGQDLFAGLSNMVPEMLEAVHGLLQGDEAYERTGSAIVNLLRLYGDMGEAPLVRKNKDGNITNNFNIWMAQQNEASIEEMKNLSAEKLLECFNNGTFELPKSEYQVSDSDRA